LRENIKAEVNDDVHTEIETLDSELAGLTAEVMRLFRETQNGVMGKTEYETLVAANEAKQKELRQQKNNKTLKSEGVKLVEFRIGKLERILTETVFNDFFDSDMFKELIDSATVTREKIIFNFKCGITQEIIL
jgi:hypothetical protein